MFSQMVMGKTWGKNMANLTAARVRAITEPGLHGDGRGLYLRVARGGSRAWIQRITIEGRRRDIGLGGFPAVSLARARQLAEANLPRWRNGKHTAGWIQSLGRHAFPILGEMRVDRIERADVLAVLTPIWGTRPETARRVRQRIRSVLRWCLAHGYVEHNAAGEAIDGALPPMPRLKAHFRALPYREVPAALETVARSRASLAARTCFRFLVLTAARSGEARGAAWDEIDEDAREWRIPARRMKGGIEHRVPLSGAALAVLDEVRPLRDAAGLIFPSPARPGQPMSDMTLTKVLQATGLAERATVHGFRSSFRDWAAECTNAPHAVMELSLAHAVGSAVEAAYARSTLLEKRRALMEQWATFLLGEGGEVVPLERAAGADLR